MNTNTQAHASGGCLTGSDMLLTGSVVTGGGGGGQQGVHVGCTVGVRQTEGAEGHQALLKPTHDTLLPVLLPVLLPYYYSTTTVPAL